MVWSPALTPRGSPEGGIPNSRPPGSGCIRSALLGIATLLLLAGTLPAADKYTGHCDLVFECESTLHAFSGDIANLVFVGSYDTNAAGIGVISTRLEIKPRQLSTHHKKRDENMYKMFQEERYPVLFAVVTNVPVAEAKLDLAATSSGPGKLPVQLTFCGTTREVVATITNTRLNDGSLEFDLQADLSLKAFNLKPPSVLFGAISVADAVKVKAHVVMRKAPPNLSSN